MKQLQKHLIIILVMGIMLAAALIGGISTFTFREISSNDNRAIMKSIQQTDMEELNDTKTRRKILATIFSLRISRLLPSTTA